MLNQLIHLIYRNVCVSYKFMYTLYLRFWDTISKGIGKQKKTTNNIQGKGLSSTLFWTKFVFTFISNLFGKRFFTSTLIGISMYLPLKGMVLFTKSIIPSFPGIYIIDITWHFFIFSLMYLVIHLLFKRFKFYSGSVYKMVIRNMVLTVLCVASPLFLDHVDTMYQSIL